MSDVFSRLPLIRNRVLHLSPNIHQNSHHQKETHLPYNSQVIFNKSHHQTINLKSPKNHHQQLSLTTINIIIIIIILHLKETNKVSNSQYTKKTDINPHYGIHHIKQSNITNSFTFCHINTNSKYTISYPTIKHQFNKVRLLLQKLAFSDYFSEIKVNKFKRLNRVYTQFIYECSSIYIHVS